MEGISQWPAYRDKEAWKTERLRLAAETWGQYTKHIKRGCSREQDFFHLCEAEDPGEAIREHFQRAFRDPRAGEIERELDGIMESLGSVEAEPFSEDEIQKAIQACADGKATGLDGVPIEMLKAMCQSQDNVKALAEFYSGALTGGQGADAWSHTLLKLLAKVQPPAKAKDLRPIAISSQCAKVMSKLLLNRLQTELSLERGNQMAGRGRQPGDLLWTMKQTMMLAHEWGKSMAMIKLDIKAAFDATSRPKLARKICQRCAGKPAEARALIMLLKTGHSHIVLPWTSATVTTTQGVTQGLPESPILFSKIVEEVLHANGNSEGCVFDDLSTYSGCFMDDIILWKRDLPTLQSEPSARSCRDSENLG